MQSAGKYDHAMARKRTELKITDPVTLRALAHPARQRLITELYSGEVLTATEAAEIVGLTPSATSYHLRALEKFGIVTREDASTDARQRPWRSAAGNISVQPEALRAVGAQVGLASVSEWFRGIDAGLERALREIQSGSETPGHTSQGRLWLTDEESVELRDRIIALSGEYRDRSRGDHPEGARPWDVYHALLPAEDRADA